MSSVFHDAPKKSDNPGEVPAADADQNEQRRMHADEILLDRMLVQRLLAEQFPHLTSLPLRLVHSTGTVNAIYRLGDELAVRLARVPAWADSLLREWRWLPRLKPHLSLAIPEPLALGSPTAFYPHPWAIYRWLEGDPYQPHLIADEAELAVQLADFIRQLRSMAPVDAPRAGRAPLAELDEDTCAAIHAAHGLIDVHAAQEAWRNTLSAPRWDGEPVWLHGDLIPSNLLLQHGRLHAVIDFGSVGIGDPAMDLIPAWSVLGPRGRAVFRRALAPEQGAWQRARAYALHQALRIIPYYAVSNPAFTAEAQRTVQQVLSELGTRLKADSALQAV